jgi:acetyl-CoA carboxylase alpha subunit
MMVFAMLKGESDFKQIDGMPWQLIGDTHTKSEAQKIVDDIKMNQPEGFKYARIIKKKFHYSIYARRRI